MSLDHTADVKLEIQTDPVSLGYGTWATTADDARIQALIHDPTMRPRTHVLVNSWQVVNCYDPTEFSALSALQATILSAVLAGGQVDLATSTVRSILSAVFPAVPGTSRAALLALWAGQSQTQSRASELGWSLSVGDITYARTA